MSIKDQALSECLATMGRIAALADLLLNQDQNHDHIIQALAHSISVQANMSADHLMDAMDAAGGAA